MTNMTITITEDLKLELQKHKEVNWSAVMRKAAEEHIRKIHLAEMLAKKSKFTQKDVKELDKLVKQGLAREHGL